MMRGSSKGGWVQAGSWTYASDVAVVDFTGLGGYSEVLVHARGITMVAAGYRAVRVSTDNGSTYLAGTNYQSVNSAGVESNSATIYPQFTGSGSARGFWLSIRPFGVAGARKWCNASGGVIYSVMDTGALNAIRVFGQEGDFATAEDFTAGNIEVWGKIG